MVAIILGGLLGSYVLGIVKVLDLGFDRVAPRVEGEVPSLEAEEESVRDREPMSRLAA